MEIKNRPRHPEKVNKPINPIKKKPEWIRSKLLNSKEFFLTKTVVNKDNLVTVCQEANCPNITECWSKRHACLLLQHSVILGQFASWQTVTRLSLLTTVLVKKNSLLFSNLDLIHSGFFLIGFIGLLTFSGCLGLFLISIVFDYIGSLSFFSK